MSQNRIKQLREERGWNQSQLAKASGFFQSEISMWESGKRSITDRQIRRIALALGVDPSEVISDRGGSGKVMVPILGFIGAGAEIFPIDDHEKGAGIDEVECPSQLDPTKAIALEVKGDSMEPLISEGFILFYEERHYGVPEEFIGKICAVRLPDGKTLVKRIKRGKGIGKYNLISLNTANHTIENTAVEWSALIKVMVQN